MFYFLVQVLAPLVLLLVLGQWFRPKHQTAGMTIPPVGSFLHTVPVLGYLLTWGPLGPQHPMAYLFKMYKKYGPTFRGMFGPQLVYITADPALVFGAFKDEGMFTTLDFLPHVSSLLGTTGPKDTEQHSRWKRVYAAGTGANWVEGLVPSLVNVAERHVKTWQKNGGFNIHDAADALLSDFIFEGALGLSFKAADDQQAVRQWGIQFLSGFYVAPINLPFTAYGRALQGRHALAKAVWREIEPEVEQIRSKMKAEAAQTSETEVSFRPLWETLIRTQLTLKPNATPEDLTTAVLQGFFAVTDTSRQAVSSVLVALALNERVRMKIKEEQDQVIAEHGVELNSRSLAAMPYLDAAVKESLRLFSPIHGSFKRTTQALQAGKYVIPKGAILLWDGPLMHATDPACWDGDLTVDVPRHMDYLNHFHAAYQPERWLDSATKPRHYYPFCGGKRVCLGQQLVYTEFKVLVALLVRHFNFQLQDPHMLRKARFFPFLKASPGTDRVVAASWST